jgi:hypothetical protein
MNCTTAPISPVRAEPVAKDTRAPRKLPSPSNVNACPGFPSFGPSLPEPSESVDRVAPSWSLTVASHTHTH